MKTLNINSPLTDEQIEELSCGDYVLITGTIYSARDAAHKRMYEALEKGEELPFDIKGITVYYMGPTPPRPGNVIGSAGPTTSGRMDKYTPLLLSRGIKAMIGKGKRSEKVTEAMIENHCVYMAAVGGAGALLSKSITSSEVIAYDDLGTEAVRRMEVKDFPAVVAIDCRGNCIYK